MSGAREGTAGHEPSALLRAHLTATLMSAWMMENGRDVAAARRAADEQIEKMGALRVIR